MNSDTVGWKFIVVQNGRRAINSNLFAIWETLTVRKVGTQLIHKIVNFDSMIGGSIAGFCCFTKFYWRLKNLTLTCRFEYCRGNCRGQALSLFRGHSSSAGLRKKLNQIMTMQSVASRCKGNAAHWTETTQWNALQLLCDDVRGTYDLMRYMFWRRVHWKFVKWLRLKFYH